MFGAVARPGPKTWKASQSLLGDDVVGALPFDETDTLGQFVDRGPALRWHTGGNTPSQ